MMRLALGYRRFTPPAFAGAMVAAVVLPSLEVALLAVDVFVLQFFRDPECSPPDEPGVAAPTDGHVSVVHVEDERVCVGVFMNIIDVHVNRTPVSDSVRIVTHCPGAYKPVFSKDFDRSERVDIEFGTDAGDHEVSLIAGAFARRIYSYVAPGDKPVRGQKPGHIDFDSRIDVLLSPEFDSEDVVVEKDESVRAGETVLARWK